MFELLFLRLKNIRSLVFSQSRNRATVQFSKVKRKIERHPICVLVRVTLTKLYQDIPVEELYVRHAPTLVEQLNGLHKEWTRHSPDHSLFGELLLRSGLYSISRVLHHSLSSFLTRFIIVYLFFKITILCSALEV